MSQFTAILWDNDGVLVDTEQLYFQANVDTFGRWGHVLTEEEYVELFLASDRGTVELLARRNYAPDRVEPYRNERDRRYSELLESADRDLVIEGVKETLATLHGRVAMGIVTSCRRVHFELIHAQSGLLQYMDFVLTLEDYERCKPDPEPYLLGLARCGHPAANCLVIEDSERGLTAAKAAGLACWIVPSRWTMSMNFARADRVVEGIQDIATAFR